MLTQPQHSLPEVFIWLIANNKRVAYHRISARELIFSTTDEESGYQCGKVQTIILKLPGKHSSVPAGWGVQAKLAIFLWLGIIKHKQYCFNGLPKGYDLSSEIRNAERAGALAPSNIHYLEKHVSACQRKIIERVKTIFRLCSKYFADFSNASPPLSGQIVDWIRCVWFK